MTGLLELLTSIVALLVLSDASFEWVLLTIWRILMKNHIHGTFKICCSFFVHHFARNIAFAPLGS